MIYHLWMGKLMTIMIYNQGSYLVVLQCYYTLSEM